MSHPPLVPETRFATLIAWLSGAVSAMSGGDRLSYLLIARIIDRLRGIKQRFVRLAAKIRDGKYAPRRFAPHRPAETPRPREAEKLPRKFGWLLPLVPDAVCYRSQLEFLLRDPEFSALLAAAPASLGRPLRSLCWMLRLDPPDMIAPPARPRPLRKKPKPVAPEPPPEPPRPPHPEPPAWMRDLRRSLPQFARPLPPPRAPKNRA